MDRRRFVEHSLLVGGTAFALPRAVMAQAAPAVVTLEGARPRFTSGVQTGDALADRAIVWTRSDRPARLWVEWATTASFNNAQRVRGPHLLEDSDFAGRIDLTGLPAGQEIFYRVLLQDLHNERVLSEPMAGHLRLPLSAQGRSMRPVRFVWSGDTAGQGFGINEAWGGMKIYEQIRRVSHDFFLHCGDTIYADGPMQAQVKLPDGSMWNNVVTEEVSKVAETLNEFRGRYRYNLLDANVRAMAAEVPQVWQWDDTRSATTGRIRRTCRATPATPKRTCRSWWVAPPRPSLNTRHCGVLPTPRANGSTATCRRACCWTCSSSTCAATAGPTAPTCRPNAAPTPRSSAASSSIGSRAGWSDRALCGR